MFPDKWGFALCWSMHYMHYRKKPKDFTFGMVLLNRP